MYVYIYMYIYTHTRIYEFITVAIRDWRNGVWRTLVLVDSGDISRMSCLSVAMRRLCTVLRDSCDRCCVEPSPPVYVCACMCTCM